MRTNINIDDNLMAKAQRVSGFPTKEATVEEGLRLLIRLRDQHEMERGITIRKTIDMLIGTFCIESGISLLHSERDFDPMERHLGLAVVPVAPPP